MNRKERIKAFYAKKHFETKKEERTVDKAINLFNRRTTNIKYKLWENAIIRIQKSYKNPKKLTYIELLGCNEDEFFE